MQSGGLNTHLSVEWRLFARPGAALTLMRMSLEELFETMISDAISAALEEVGEERLSEILENGDAVHDQMPQMIEQSAGDIVKSLKRAAPEMLAERREGLGDYNELIMENWRPAFDLYEMLCRVAFEAGEDFTRTHSADAASDNDLVFYVLIRLHARACRIAEEVLVLMKNGYGQAAQSRWRTLHAVAVVAAFISTHGQEVAERYMLHEQIESARAIDEYRDKVDRLEGYEPPTDEEVEEAHQVRHELIDRFGEAFARDYGWAAEALEGNSATKGKGRLQAIEIDVGLDHLRPHYRMASHSAHANPKGILFTPDQVDRETAVLAGPSILGLADPGHGACLSLTNATGTLLTSRAGVSAAFVLQVMVQLSDEAGEAFIRCHRVVSALAQEGPSFLA
jgi:Family of unknown function (DUF5677)